MKIQTIVLSLAWMLTIPIRAHADSALAHTSGNVEVSVTDFGSLGAMQQDGKVAPNFKFPKAGNTYYLHGLSEIWVGNANGNVASAWDLTNSELVPGNWKTTATGTINEHKEPDGRQIITAQYDSSRIAGFPLNILVDQQSFSWNPSNAPNADDFIVMKLIVTNNSNIALKGIYIAIMANWEVDRPTPPAGQLSRDWVDWDEERQTLFTYDGDDTNGTNPVHTGLTLLDGKLRAHQIFPFLDVKNQKLDATLFIDNLRSLLMDGPAVIATNQQELEELGLTSWDYASIISAGPYDINAKNFVTVTFALVAGENRADLQKNVDAARRISYAPQRLTATGLDGAVALKWEGSINPSVGGYTVLRRAKGEPEFQQAGPRIITGITFDDTTVTNGVEYTYKIRPVAPSGQPLEFDSVEAKATPDIIPGPPAGFTAALNGNQIVLNWTKSTEQVEGYAIYRNHTGREPWTRIVSLPPESVRFVDVNVYPGVGYFYTITATNRSGAQSDFSTVANVVIHEETALAPESNLEHIIVVPNPYHLNANAKAMEFRNLTRRATIRIYSSAGDLIKTIEHHNETSVERWEGRNEEGVLITPGVYIYHIEALRETGRGSLSANGRFAVIR